MSAIAYAVATPDDAEAVIGLLARRFSESDPLSVAMDLTRSEMAQFLQRIVRVGLADGLTVIAREARTGKPAGVLLTDDFASPPPVDTNLISPKFLPILTLLEKLDAQYGASRGLGKGGCIHLFMLAVEVEYSGQGIAQQLVAECCANGRRRGYGQAVTEATGRVSQQVFRKSGFAEQIQIGYREFLYEGEAVFSSITEHEAAILMDKTLP
jgi:ribosomal protein S18 acetylase RimI-like enzyme